MTNPPLIAGGSSAKNKTPFALDLNALARLRYQAQSSPDKSLRNAAQQFEAIFVQMLLSQAQKSNLSSDSPFNSAASNSYRSMLDQQMSFVLAGVGQDKGTKSKQGLGLADEIVKQMSKASVNPKSINAAALDTGLSTLDFARLRMATTEITQPSSSLRSTVDRMEKNALSMVLDKLDPSAIRALRSDSDKSLSLGLIPQIPNSYSPNGSSSLEKYNLDRHTKSHNQAENTPENNPENQVVTSGPLGNQKNAPKKLGDQPLTEKDIDTRQQFLQRFLPAAKRAEAVTGIPASYILGQAALESGWGKREIRDAQGNTSFNLFGIKANSSWKGKSVAAITTEYQDGIAKRSKERFRAYDSYEASFEDWARLMANSPRYGKVMKNSNSAESFAVGLQTAGYATDPAYSKKLVSTIRSAMRVVV